MCLGSLVSAMVCVVFKTEESWMTPTETIMVVIGGGILTSMIVMEVFLVIRERRCKPRGFK